MKTVLWILSTLSLSVLCTWIYYQPVSDADTSSQTTDIPAYAGTSTCYTPRNPKTKALKSMCNRLSGYAYDVATQRDHGASQARALAEEEIAALLRGTGEPSVAIASAISSLMHDTILEMYSRPQWSASDVQEYALKACKETVRQTS